MNGNSLIAAFFFLATTALAAQERLPGVQVHGRTPCRVHPETAAQTASLWSVAREALESVTRPSARPPVWTLVEWRRTLDRGQRLRRERLDTHRVTARNPFARPVPGNLERVGYIQRHGLSTVYYGPDAELLLSERFLRAHCFRRVEGTGANAGLTGLAFEPLPRADRPDVAGVLWVDTLPAGAALVRAEYAWTNAPEQARAPGVGGRADFVRLASGGWIIRRWNIRMPRPAAGLDAGYDGYTDQGGEVIAVAAQDPRPSGPWKVERSRRGDTAVVRTTAGSTWGDRVRLVEELRIGTRDGEGPDAFGFLTGFALFPDGVIAVFDQTVPALRLFRPDGKHLRTLGRDGAGPGEYRNASLGLAVDRNGVLQLYDPRNTRINRWKQDGTVLPSWRAPGRLYTAQAMQLDTAGNTYVKLTIGQPQPGQPWEIALLRLDSAGTVVDTVHRPAISGPSPAGGSYFAPQKPWLMARSGHLISGSGAQYSILVAPPRGAAVRIERVIPQVRLLPAERANYQELVDAARRDPRVVTTRTTDVPDSKPFFTELHTDLDGRIWVRVSTRGEEYDPPPEPPLAPGATPRPPLRWRSPTAWDVFERDGTYLGQLALPWRTTLAEARGSSVWAIQRGEDDENYIIRYRIAGVP